MNEEEKTMPAIYHKILFDSCSMWTRPIGIYDTILRNH